MLWKDIAKIFGCKQAQAPPGYGPFYLLPVPQSAGLASSNWMIGEYRHLTALASDLRKVTQLQDFVTQQRVRFGLRETDRPPVTDERQIRFGTTKAGAGAGTNFEPLRSNPRAAPATSNAVSSNRRTDREENVRLFWQTQTPQSHHIVEYNHLETIGASHPGSASEIDYDRLPCVLLAGRVSSEIRDRSAAGHARSAQGSVAPQSPLDLQAAVYAPQPVARAALGGVGTDPARGQGAGLTCRAAAA